MDGGSHTVAAGLLIPVVTDEFTPFTAPAAVLSTTADLLFLIIIRYLRNQNPSVFSLLTEEPISPQLPENRQRQKKERPCIFRPLLIQNLLYPKTGIPCIRYSIQEGNQVIETRFWEE